MHAYSIQAVDIDLASYYYGLIYHSSWPCSSYVTIHNLLYMSLSNRGYGYESL